MKLLFLGLVIVMTLLCSTPSGQGGTMLLSPVVVIQVAELTRRERRRGLTRRRHRGP